MKTLKINAASYYSKFKSGRLLTFGLLIVSLIFLSSCENEKLETTTAETDSYIIEKSGNSDGIAPGNLYSNGVNL